MNHYFDIAIATKYGTNVAIFLSNIAHWLHKNVSNNKHFIDGLHWTYNSQEAFIKTFPYWTRQNIRTVIKKCKDENLIIIGNYNETKYDRTGWYALTETGLDLFPLLKSLGCNQPMEKSEPTFPLVRINQPIPNNKPYIKTNRESKRKKRAPLSDDYLPKGKSHELWLKTSQKVNTPQELLLNKFKNLMKSSGKESLDWDAEFENFLLRERPSTITKQNINQPTQPYAAVNYMKEHVSQKNIRVN